MTTRIALTGAFAVALALPVVAQDGPSKGCYLREYSGAHLASHPDQVVHWIKLRVWDDEMGNRLAAIRAQFAHQGHVARDGFGGRVMDNFMICWRDRGKAFCGVECDGGSIEFLRDDAKGVVFRTQGVVIGDVEGCGGFTTLAEVPGQYVSYRLNRVPDAQCDGL